MAAIAEIVEMLIDIFPSKHTKVAFNRNLYPEWFDFLFEVQTMKCAQKQTVNYVLKIKAPGPDDISRLSKKSFHTTACSKEKINVKLKQ